MLKPLSTFEYGLAQEATNLRNQAKGMPDGVPRDELLRKAGQIDVASGQSVADLAPARSDIK